MVTCQSCGKYINVGEKVVKIEVGKLGFTAHPHAKVYGKEVTWFHRNCEIAIGGGD